MTLTEMLEDKFLAPDAINAKEVFKAWLADVGLPDYLSIDLKGNEFNVTDAIRKILILLVDDS